MKRGTRKNGKRSVVFGVILFLLSCVPGIPGQCYAKEAENGNESIDVMVNKTEEEMRPYKEMFQSRYPNIDINYIYLEDYENQAKEMIESGDYADVLFIPGSVSDEIYEDCFEVLGDAADLSRNYKYLEQAKRIDSSIYGLPSYAYTSGIIYNEAVFKKAGITQMPKTTDAFLEDLRAIRQYTDAIPFYTNYVSDWALNIWETYPFIDMTGDMDYKQNIFVNEKNPYSIGSSHDKVYHLLYDIVEEGLCEDDLTKGDWAESKKLLNDGKIGCVAMGSWAITQFKNAGDHGEDVVFMPFPNEIDGKQYSTISTDYCYAINKNSNHKEAARAYIDFMLNESGYALNNDVLSIVKTDPVPESYVGMSDVVLLMNHSPKPGNQGKYETLSKNLNLTDGTEQKRVMEAAAGLSDETLDDIYKDWNERWESSRTQDMTTDNEVSAFSSDEIVLDQYSVELSELEQEYIEQTDAVKVGYLKNFAPFQYEKNQKFMGVGAKMCQMIEDQTGIKFTYFSYDNYDEMVDAIQKGNIDMVAGIGDMGAYSDTIYLSKNYAEFTNVLVKNPSVEAEGIDKKQAAAVQGFPYNYFEGLEKVSYEEDFSDVLQKVNQGKAAYTIANYYTVNYYMRENNYNYLIILPMTSKDQMYFGFSKDVDARLIAICNKCIYSIPEGRIELMLLENMDPPIQKINLKRLIEIYPLQSFLTVFGSALLLIFIIFWIFRTKQKSILSHELDAKRYQILADLTNEYVFEFDCEKQKMIFEKKFYETFSFGGEVDVKNYLGDNEELNLFLRHFKEAEKQKDMESKTFQYLHNDGKKVWYRLTLSRIYNRKGDLIRIIGKISNVQKEMEEKQQILAKAERDPLTGLFNREGFKNVYDRYHKSGEDGTYMISILDFDNFKQVNDSLGHAGGDEALKLLAKEMQDVFGADGITVRFGGDEFLVYMPMIESREKVKVLMQTLVKRMNRTMDYEGEKIELSISFGAVLAERTEDVKDALKRADEVLYALKRTGKNDWKLQED